MPSVTDSCQAIKYVDLPPFDRLRVTVSPVMVSLSNHDARDSGSSIMELTDFCL
jgi:hypothetical protein